MSVVLLDTTVVSLLHPRKKHDPLRAKYEPHMKGHVLALSFQSVAELWYWAEYRGWGQSARRQLDAFVRRFLVIPYDYGLAQVWAQVLQATRRQGRRLESADCWIAATAVYRNIPLLVHDRDFIGLSVPGLAIVSYAGGSP